LIRSAARLAWRYPTYHVLELIHTHEMILKRLTHIRLGGGLYSLNAYACCVTIVWGHIARRPTYPSMVELLFVHRVCDKLIINTKFVADLENAITKLGMRKSLQDIATTCV
jgi:hypothetical protein